MTQFYTDPMSLALGDEVAIRVWSDDPEFETREAVGVVSKVTPTTRTITAKGFDCFDPYIVKMPKRAFRPSETTGSYYETPWEAGVRRYKRRYDMPTADQLNRMRDPISPKWEALNDAMRFYYRDRREFEKLPELIAELEAATEIARDLLAIAPKAVAA